MSPYSRGLVVGKFAPLHRGHELLIARALAGCRELLVLSYSNPELPRCEPASRQRWLERSFPSARCIVVSAAWLASHAPGVAIPPNDAACGVQRDFVSWLCRDVLGVGVDAVFTSEDYGAGFARALTAGLRVRWPQHPDVAHELVDLERRTVPISGTRVRADPHAARAFLADHVYAAFVDRVALVGGESSGKSQLTAALAEHFASEGVAEYGRELWVRREGKLAFEDLLQIAERQIELEQAASERATRYLFCDTTPATTLLYCRDMFGRADPRLESLATRNYALHVLCAPDFPFVQDGTRRDAAFRQRQHAWYLEHLDRLGAPWMLAEGGIAERVRAVAARLLELGRSA